MSKSIVNIGIAGLASIARRHVIPSILLMPDKFDLVAVSSRSLDKAGGEAERYNCQVFSYEGLIKESLIDAVYIPLPNSLHYKYVKMALENEKHVLVEKSLGCTLEEVVELVEIARSNNLVLLENFQFRFHSQLKMILRMIDSGVVGELRSLRVSFGFPPFKDQNNIRYNKELCGGALLDAGAYAMKIAPYFLGRNLQVRHGSMYFDKEYEVDIWGGGVIQQQGGPLFCQFSYGFDNYYQCALEMWGSRGKMFTNRIFTAPPDVQPELVLETDDGVKKIVMEADNHFVNMLGYFHNLIDGGNQVDCESEYDSNIFQANLIAQFNMIADKY